MRRKTVSGIMLTLLLIGMLALAFNVQQAHASPGFVPGTGETTKINLMDAANPTASPVLYPDGQQYIEINDTYDLAESFTVYLNITDVTELRMYSAGVTYDPAILECTNFEEGEFFYRVDEQYRDEPGLSDPGPFSEGYKGPGDDPAYLGYYNSLTWVLEKPGNASGSGTLSEFDFEVVGYGFTLIDIIVSPMVAEETILADVSDGDIKYNTVDIIFDNTGMVEEHELLVSVEAPDVLKLGESSLLNATVENFGLNDETDVELQLLINGSVVNSTTITQLLSGSDYTIDYLWTPTTEATYNITAYVVPVPDEQSTDNNVATKLMLVPLDYWCTLTVYSVPSGVTFTVDDVSYTTPWSGTYGEGVSVSLVMPEFHDGYVWGYWWWIEDGDIITDSNRIKSVIVDTDIALTGYYFQSGFHPGTGEATKIWLMDASDPTAVPVTYPDGQQYVELNDTYGVGDTFTVWANVTNVTELRMYQVGVTYDPAILECTGYGEGELFYRAPEEYRTNLPNQPILWDETGYLGHWNHVTWVLKKPGNVSGTGTLASFNFRVVGYGVTLIDIILTGPPLAFITDVYGIEIDFNTIDIIFDNRGYVPPPPVGGKATPINIPMNKPELQIPWIWLSTIILSLAVTVVYVKKRKRNTEIIS